MLLTTTLGYFINTGIILGTLGALLLLLKGMWKLVKKVEETITNAGKVDAILSSVNSLSTNVNTLVAEFKPNGGLTHKDAMTRIESSVAAVSKKVDRIDNKITFDKKIIKDLAHNASSGYMITDKIGKVTEASIVACKIFERTEFELLEFKLLNYINAKDKTRVRSVLAKAIKNGDNFTEEFRITTQKPKTVRCAFERIYTEDDYIGYYGVIMIIN